jgi:hypothetical protein
MSYGGLSGGGGSANADDIVPQGKYDPLKRKLIFVRQPQNSLLNVLQESTSRRVSPSNQCFCHHCTTTSILREMGSFPFHRVAGTLQLHCCRFPDP